MTAITKHVVLERGNNNNRAYSLALGNICTGATFACLTLTERKKGGNGKFYEGVGDSRDLAPIGVSMVSEDFAFATGNTIVIDEGMVIIL